MEINIDFKTLKKILKEEGRAEEIWNKGKFWSFNPPLRTDIRKNNDDKIVIEFGSGRWSCDVVFKKKQNTNTTEMLPTINYISFLKWTVGIFLAIIFFDVYENGLANVYWYMNIFNIVFMIVLALGLAVGEKLLELLGYFLGPRGNISRKLSRYIEENYDEV